MPQAGHLSVFLGPMGACKTTRAIEQCTQFSTFGMSVVYVRHAIDSQRTLAGGIEGVFTSHNASNRYIYDKVDTLSCSSLTITNFDKYQVVVIDEAQFFTNLVEVVKELVLKGKTVQIYGLVGDFKKEKFGSTIDLIPMADVFEQLTAKCVGCLSLGEIRSAAFTYKSNSNSDTDVIEVGGFGAYKPLCGNCYRLAVRP